MIERGIEDYFSGSIVENKEGSVTVLGHNGLKGKKKKYYCHCETCYSDEELFKDTMFITSKTCLARGNIPCGCSSSYKYSDYHYSVLVKRLLKDTRYTFVKVIRDGKKTLFELSCKFCSPDEELWGEGSIITTISGIKRGIMPCGCSDAPKYTEKQNHIIMNRHLPDGMKTIGYDRKTKKFTLHCDICSKDEDLWPNGSIQTTMCSVKNGNLSCGCGKTPRWTERQNLIRVNRFCKEKGFIFKGWYGGYNGTKSYLNLENISTGRCWRTTTLSSLFNGRGDITEHRKKVFNKSLEVKSYEVESFMKTGRFLEGTKFKKIVKDNKRVCQYWCPKCSTDEYVKEGLCSGWFSSTVSNLRGGKLCCRCSDRYSPTKRQAEYNISNVLNKRDLGKFWSWDGRFNSISKSRVLWKCNTCNQTHSTPYQKLVDYFRCPEELGGFKSTDKGFLYFYEYYGYCESYIKYGITNKCHIKRNKEITKTSKLDSKVLSVFYHKDGKIIRDIETEISRAFDKERRACSENLMPSGYTETILFTEENYNKLLSFTSELDQVV